MQMCSWWFLLCLSDHVHHCGSLGSRSRGHGEGPIYRPRAPDWVLHAWSSGNLDNANTREEGVEEARMSVGKDQSPHCTEGSSSVWSQVLLHEATHASPAKEAPTTTQLNELHPLGLA